MGTLSVKNWEEFQHYKQRNPPWIKLHNSLLSDYEYLRLHDASKLHLLLIWLFASRSDNKIPDDPVFLKNIFQLETEPDLNLLVDKGFLVRDAECKHDASKALVSEEERRDRGETEERSLPGGEVTPLVNYSSGGGS